MAQINNAKALIPKDWERLHEPINQFQWSYTWILLLHSFRFSTISTCMFISFIFFSIPAQQLMTNLWSSLPSFWVLRVPTFYLLYSFTNTRIYICSYHLKQFSFIFSIFSTPKPCVISSSQNGSYNKEKSSFITSACQLVYHLILSFSTLLVVYYTHGIH